MITLLHVILIQIAILMMELVNIQNQVLIVGGVGCNKRLQQMMGQMVTDRGGTMSAMDHRYCIDNGAMIAQAGIFALQFGEISPIEDTWCTQRYRTDQVLAIWRSP